MPRRSRDARNATNKRPVVGLVDNPTAAPIYFHLHHTARLRAEIGRPAWVAESRALRARKKMGWFLGKDLGTGLFIKVQVNENKYMTSSVRLLPQEALAVSATADIAANGVPFSRDRGVILLLLRLLPVR